jgi:hypothetical protein
VSSAALPLQQYKSKTPITLIGVTLIVLAALAFVYSLIPQRTKSSEIDLGTKLQLLNRPLHFEVRTPSEDRNFAIEAAPVFVNWVQAPTPALVRPNNCAITGIPRTITEGATTIKVSYSCNDRIVETPKVRWSTTAGKISAGTSSVVQIDTTGLSGKRIVLTATWFGCGRTPCERSFTALVVEKSEPSPSPTPSPSPSPSPSPTPTVSPSPSVSPSLSPSPVESATVSKPTPAPTIESTSESVFAPGKNGKLTVVWPDTVLQGWPNVCEIRYEPPPGWSAPDGYDVQAAFFLTSPVGIANEALGSSFQRLDGRSRVWTIPLEPAAKTGAPVSATLMMRVRVRRESSMSDIDVQPLQSAVEAPPLTRNETWTASAMSAVLGFSLLGFGRRKGADFTESVTYTAGAEDENLVTKSVDWIKTTAVEVAGALRRRSDAESDTASSATKGASIAPPQPASKGIEEEEVARVSDESPRYTDVTIYEDHWYPSDNLDEATRVPDDAPLVASNLYTLEVAIRLKRTGIASDLPAKREVENPRQEQETLTIHIIATPLRGFKLVDRLATVKWPYNQDSEPALFRLEIDPDFDGERPGSIEIRILDESLNLLDVVSLKVALVANQGDQPGDIPMRQLVWEDKDSEGLALAGTSKPRLAEIRVRPVTNGFTFEFVFYSAGGKAVNISVFRNISTNDLSNLLAKLRDFWTKLVVTTYSRKLTVSKSTYDTYLKDLRDLGMQAWSLLFDTRTSNQEGASERVGQIVAAFDERLTEVASLLQTNDNKTIQITYADAGADFIFPWSILHPPTARDEPVDPLRFWGARYRIEQVTGGPRRDRIDERPVNILFALDPSFGDAPSQKKMFEDYQNANQAELQISAPISDQKTLESYLIRDPSVHLLYFYCHGYAATRPGMFMADGVQALQRYIEEIRKQANDDSATADALEKLLQLTSKMAGESWIYLGNSEVRETDLTLLKFFEKRRPIVFLNMCQSADLVPSMSSGLVRMFLKHDASAVVGTESPMTSLFADAFARRVLDALLTGDNIGMALWKARRHFLTERNPLGLAYTLYGRADANLCSVEKPLYPKNN